MGLRGTLSLFLVLAALGAALWFSDGRNTEEPALTASVLDGRSIVEARHITIRPDSTAAAIELERDGSGAWRVVEPIRDLASAATVEKLRTAFDTARLLVAYEADEVDQRILAETGLAAPRAGLRVEWPDGAVVELAIGLPGPYGQDLFARRVEDGASGRIYRVQQALLNAVQLTPTDARERLVFRTETLQVDTIRVSRRFGDREDVIELVRRGVGWVMRKPAALRIDPGQAQTFVRALLGLRIDQFLPGEPQPGLAPIDLDAPDAVIDIDGGFGRERVAMYFVEGRAGLIGNNQLRGLWFSCQTRGYEQVVEAPVRGLRAFWLLSSSVDEIRTLRLLSPEGTPLELERRDGGPFRMVRPIARAADPTSVSELLQGLRSLGVVEFVADDVEDFTSYGLGDDALVLEVEARRGRPERLLIGRDAGEETTWVRRADEPHVVSVPRATAERLRRGWLAYVDLQILRIQDGGRVRRIRRAEGDGAGSELVRGDDGRWCRGGEGDPLPIVADVFDLLRDLRAVAVVLAEEVGDATDRGSLELVAGSGQVVARIGLYEAADGRALCDHADAPGVRFVLSARDGRDVLGLR